MALEVAVEEGKTMDSQLISVIGLAVLGALAITVFAVGATKAVYRVMRGPLANQISAQYRPEEVLLQDLKANSFGVESEGLLQPRGNGGLVLTRDGLHFFMFLPRKQVRVPLAAISEVTLTKSHLGKVTPFDLLKVRFSTDGGPDAIAWYLTDPRAWKTRIEALKDDGR